MNVRTDLALEERELREASEEHAPRGVTCEEWDEGAVHVTKVHIRTKAGAAALHKPIGSYVTLEMPAQQVRSAPSDCADVLFGALRALLPETGDVLVVGLGNEAVTPDAIGPRTLRHVLVTRHLRRDMPDLFDKFRQVSAIAPGVLGRTGMESAEIVRGIVGKIKPAYVIAIDALAAAKPGRLCTSIQLADTGIIPGSGVQNDRAALNRGTLGVPVFAVGVPTVCDLRSLLESQEQMIVTPSDIDMRVNDLSRIVSSGLNRALHPTVPPQDLAEFVGG
ncbi:MAG: GPR endopeptidase [Oscillospiraceae bacterium]|nr:GPR endopeptidase [Oscillospiraceae bacterium]